MDRTIRSSIRPRGDMLQRGRDMALPPAFEPSSSHTVCQGSKKEITSTSLEDISFLTTGPDILISTHGSDLGHMVAASTAILQERRSELFNKYLAFGDLLLL